MTFPLEKILTISARDWCEANNKKLKDYRVIGVHQTGSGSEPAKHIGNSLPRGTDVVVNFRFSLYQYTVANTGYTSSGTALIPKKK